MNQIAKQRKLLLQLRSELVGHMHTQPFTIYDDVTIERLLEAQPKSLEELANVKGFPKDGKRIRGFGNSVIDIFTKCDRITGFAISTKEKDGDLVVGSDLKSLSAF